MDHEVKFWAIEVLRIFNEELLRLTEGDVEYHYQALVAVTTVGKAIENTIERLEGENNRN
jgi:hypothetical protein